MTRSEPPRRIAKEVGLGGGIRLPIPFPLHRPDFLPARGVHCWIRRVQRQRYNLPVVTIRLKERQRSSSRTSTNADFPTIHLSTFFLLCLPHFVLDAPPSRCLPRSASTTTGFWTIPFSTFIIIRSWCFTLHPLLSSSSSSSPSSPTASPFPFPVPTPSPSPLPMPATTLLTAKSPHSRGGIRLSGSSSSLLLSSSSCNFLRVSIAASNAALEAAMATTSPLPAETAADDILAMRGGSGDVFGGEGRLATVEGGDIFGGVGWRTAVGAAASVDNVAIGGLGRVRLTSVACPTGVAGSEGRVGGVGAGDRGVAVRARSPEGRAGK
ncbi:hypothetical protein B0H11DRAFT_2258561 [Mycena galericulata]|nr:hypothetical protein B0H11DRAFT_2258561 [Mycena galericulata]